MAELGNVFGTEEVKTGEITVEMLDYDYVKNCNDVKKLRGIINVLESGKEGVYPQVSVITLILS